MSTIRIFATVAIAGLTAAPLAAQTVQDRIEQARRRAESSQQTTVRDRVEQARRRADGGVFSRTGTGGILTRTDGRRGSKVPPGHRPPPGMCRVWIDGVSPGHQPEATDCASARVQSARIPNSRVIYGDDASFPGKGKGKFKNRDRTRDGTFGGIWDRRNDSDDRWDDDEDSDSDGRGRGKFKAGKGKKSRGW